MFEYVCLSVAVALMLSLAIKARAISRANRELRAVHDDLSCNIDDDLFGNIDDIRLQQAMRVSELIKLRDMLTLDIEMLCIPDTENKKYRLEQINEIEAKSRLRIKRIDPGLMGINLSRAHIDDLIEREQRIEIQISELQERKKVLISQRAVMIGSRPNYIQLGA